MENKSNVSVKYQPEPAPGPLKKFDLYTIGLGATVGVGILTYTGGALAYTGHSTWLAFIVGILWGLFQIIPYIFIAFMFRCGGGEYSVIGGTLGPKWAGVFALSKIPNIMSLAVLGSGAAMYIKSVWPNSNAVLISGIIVAVFFFINVFGVKAMSRLQNIMSIALLVSLLTFIVIGLFNLKQPVFNFKSPEFITNGAHGFMSAVVLVAAACTAYGSTVLVQGRNAQNSQRDMPKAMLLVAPSIMILYVGIGIVAGGVLPLEQVANQPLTYVAQEIMPGPLFLIFMACGPFLCIATTLNSGIPGIVGIFEKGVEDGWLPKSLAKKNKYGASWILYVIFGVGAVAITLLGISPVRLVTNLNLFYSSFNLLFLAAVFMAVKKYPDAWEASALRKFPKWLFYVLMLCSVAINGYSFYNVCTNLTSTVVLFSVGFLVLLFAYAFIRSKTADINILISMWPIRKEKAE